MTLLRSFATVGGYTAISRVLGFLRDVLIAAAIGTGPVADAFFVAFKFPNLFRRLFAEGAFNAAFVPLFAERLENEGQAAARHFAEDVLAVLLSWLLLFTALAMAAMPWLMPVIAIGFPGDPEQFDRAVALTRICFPYLLFMALVALLGGILNSLYRFAAAAAAPIVLNVFFIASLIVVLPFFRDAPGQVLAWTVTAAGLAQFLLVLLACHYAGIRLRLVVPRLSAGVRRLFALMGPGLLAAGAMQVNLLIGNSIATLQSGAVSYLYYADRVYQLPLGLIGIGIGVVLLPDLSRKLRGGLDEAAGHSLNRALELGLFLTLPAAVALMTIPHPIVSVLFERGRFDAEAAAATAWALTAFAAGLPAYVLVKILQPPFFARQDTVTPLRFALASVAANIVLSLLLFWQIGFVGIAIATSVAAWLNAGLLGMRLRSLAFLQVDRRLRRRLPWILTSSLAMGGVLLLLQDVLGDWLAGSEPQRLLALAVLVAGGLVLYAALALVTGAADTAELKALLRRRR